MSKRIAGRPGTTREKSAKQQKCCSNDERYLMGLDWEHSAFPGVQQAVVEHYGDDVQGIPGPVHVWYIQV